jgi:hypothetical protein
MWAEIESLNIADLDLLYKKLEDEDAELYGGGLKSLYNDLFISKDYFCPGDIYGGPCPYAVSVCPSLIRCVINGDECPFLVRCISNFYNDDNCPENVNCSEHYVCFVNNVL